MSSPDALATVTATLRHLLNSVAATVTTKPPSVARAGESGNQLNIFLYAAHHNSAFSNFPVPGESRTGENAYPPLPLILNYLITAYGANDDDISGQQLLGRAMSILHDHPLLGRSDIEGISPDSGLQQQVERVRITPAVLTLDDMFKLWSSFQSTDYRLSTGYQVSVVLIDSTRSNRAALPVLKRGEQDRGASISAAPAPAIIGLRFPKLKPGAEYGDRISILGENLASDDFVVRFQHPLLADPIDIPPGADRSATEIAVNIPAQADDLAIGSKWPAGFYSLTFLVQRPDLPAWVSNALVMPLVPKIVSVTPGTAPAGNVVLSIECLPQVWPGQRVLLLFGDQVIKADSIITPAVPSAFTTLAFTVVNAVARINPYVLRLRIDGVDSIPVDFSGDTPKFATNQQVTIT